MSNLIHERQRCNSGMIFLLFSLTVYHLMTFNNGVVAAEYSNGELEDILYLERLNAMQQPQKKYFDEDYGELISAPREVMKRGGNDAINRIISRLRPTYSKRPRESKRGVDFGLARGFSGSQALKHALGLEAARYVGGPGRKKRTGSSAGPIAD